MYIDVAYMICLLFLFYDVIDIDKMYYFIVNHFFLVSYFFLFFFFLDNFPLWFEYAMFSSDLIVQEVHALL